MAATSDERWRACQDLGTIGPIIQRQPLAQQPEMIQQIYDLLKETLTTDASGIVRYHAAMSVGKLCPAFVKRRPELVFEICGLLQTTGLKDPYDRVRRGSMTALGIIAEMSSKRPELAQKVREVCSKVLSTDAYEIVRSDACTFMGKVGPPPTLGLKNSHAAKEMMKPFYDAAEGDSSKLVRVLATLSLHKMHLAPPENLTKSVNEVDKLLRTLDHWSYWSQRECMARALAEMGPLLTHMPQVLDKVLTLLEKLAADSVWDVRVAACRGFGDFAPPVSGPRPTSGTTSTVKEIGIGPELQRRSVPVLQRATKDSNAEVRAVATAALAKRQ